MEIMNDNDINARLQIADLLIRKHPKMAKELESELDDRFKLWWNQRQVLDIPRKIEVNKSNLSAVVKEHNELVEKLRDENKELMEEWSTKYKLIQNQIVGYEDEKPKYKMPIEGEKTYSEILEIIKKNKPNIKEVSHG